MLILIIDGIVIDILDVNRCDKIGRKSDEIVFDIFSLNIGMLKDSACK